MSNRLSEKSIKKFLRIHSRCFHFFFIINLKIQHLKLRAVQKTETQFADKQFSLRVIVVNLFKETKLEEENNIYHKISLTGSTNVLSAKSKLVRVVLHVILIFRHDVVDELVVNFEFSFHVLWEENIEILGEFVNFETYRRLRTP